MGLTIWIYYNYMDMLYGLTIYIFFKWYPIDILVFDQWDINWALYGYFKCLNLLLSFKKWGYNQRATVNILFLRGSKIGHALLMFFLVVDTFIVDTFWWFLRCGKKQQQQLLRYRIAFCPASIFFCCSWKWLVHHSRLFMGAPISFHPPCRVKTWGVVDLLMYMIGA